MTQRQGLWKLKNDNGKLSRKVKNLGILDWKALIDYIRKLPYGRLTDRNNVEGVLTEGKGSCSSKHALLNVIADENHIEGVDLILGIFKMNPKNTAEVATILNEAGLDHIPEAHCYLKVNGQRIDATKQGFDINHFTNDILTEMVINVEQIGDYKVDMHKNFLKNWIREKSLPFTFTKVWEIREKCIEKISETI
ncbi:MAG: hypothetical protein KA340_15030 [Saprospiraceae bacterium]|nr:hypothetical protein [Saprospiraceae bacterium]